MPSRSGLRPRPPPAPPDWLANPTMPPKWGTSQGKVPQEALANREALFRHLKMFEDSEVWRSALADKLAAPHTITHTVLRGVASALPVYGYRHFTTIGDLTTAVRFYLANPDIIEFPSADELQVFAQDNPDTMLVSSSPHATHAAEAVENLLENTSDSFAANVSAPSLDETPQTVVSPSLSQPHQPSGHAPSSRGPPMTGLANTASKDPLMMHMATIQAHTSQLVSVMAQILTQIVPPSSAAAGLTSQLQEISQALAKAQQDLQRELMSPRTHSAPPTQTEPGRKASYASKLATQPSKQALKQHQIQARKAHAAAVEKKNSLRCDARTVCLTPTTEALRLSSFGLLTAGQKIEIALKARITPPIQEEVRLLEDVRRNHRGQLFFQVKADYHSVVSSTLNLTAGPTILKLDSLGDWTASQAEPSPTIGMNPFVVSRIPLDISMAMFVDELISSNSADLGLGAATAAESIKASRRLNRRLQDGTWVPSTTVLFYASPQVSTRLEASQNVAFGYSFHAVTKYNPPRMICLRCGVLGSHTAKDCRGKARCRFCNAEHDSRLCPNRIPPACASSNPVSPDLTDGGSKRPTDSAVLVSQSKLGRSSRGHVHPGGNQGVL